MKRLIWLPIAGFLLIAGATVAAAAPGLLNAATGVTVAASPQPWTVPGAGPVGGGHMYLNGDGLLTRVLADLVTKGTITQAQSDAITAALQQAVTDRQAQEQARAQLIQGFIADGVITQDEIDQLPADDPLRVAFDNIASNGQVTLDQLRGLGPGFGHDSGPGGHGGMRPGMWPDPDNDGSNPGASPSPSTTSTNN